MSGTLASKEQIEGFIIDKIRGYILTDENLSDLIRMTNKGIEELSEQQNERIATLDSQIKEVNSRLENLYDALETRKFTPDELAPRIHGLVSRRDQLKSAEAEVQANLRTRRLEVEDAAVMRRYLEDLRSILASASILEQKAFLKSFVKSIEVSNSEVMVNYTLPMPPTNASKETFGVLAFERNGEPAGTRTPDTLIKSQVLFH